MSEVTIKLNSPIITTDKSISEITTDGLANTGEIALATDGIVGNVNGALRKYPNPIKTFYVEKFVATGVAKWGFEPKDVKTNDVVMIKTATENLMFTVAEATNTKATLCAFTKKGGTRIVFGQKIGGMFIGIDKERVADEYTGITYEYSLSKDLLLTDVNPFTIGRDALKCVPSYYTQIAGGKSYLKLSYNKEYLLPIGASYKNYNCVFYFIVNHKGQQKLVALNTYAPNIDEPITTSLSFVDLGFSPFNLTIGKTTKQINGTADVSFSAEEITDKFNGALIQNLTTASTEAEIRKAFTDNGTVKFPTPGSIISKLDGGNRGIVVSLSEPDVTTLGRTITVYHGNDTYTIIVKSDFTKVLMPWSKVSPKRNVYTEDVKRLEPEYDEARIKDYLTPQVYRKYHIVYPVKPQTGDLVMEYHNDELRYVAIKVVRNKENPNEYTDILIPESGTANAYTRIVLKNDLTAVKSRNPYYILKTCKRAYDGDSLLALDTVKAETIENSITDAYSFTIEGRDTQLAAQLPEVGDLIKTYGEVAPVCEVLLDTDSVQHTRWFSKGKLYEVTVNTALTRVPEDPKVVYNSKKIYDEKLLNLRDTTDVAQIKKAFTPKGYAQPVIPDNGDIVQMPDGGFLIFNSVQNDEFYLYIYAPQTANTVITIQCRKDFTTAKTVIGVTRIVAYCYDGNALLDTEITTPSDIELIYTPKDVAYGYKSLYGAEPPKIGDIIIMPTKTSEILARGVVVDAVETDNTYITRWFYGGKLYEAEVTKDFTSIPKYGKVIYDTTSGTLRDLYISAGAKYNEATGFYELNGLTDITEEQMRVIYNETNVNVSGIVSGMFHTSFRTNIPRRYMGIAIMGIYENRNLEVLNISSNEEGLKTEITDAYPALYAFAGCNKLKKIIGTISFENATPLQHEAVFYAANALEDVRISKIRYSLQLKDSRNISKESVVYIIENAELLSGAAVGSIAITLHPTAYARLKDDADIVAALEAKGGIVTLVSA